MTNQTREELVKKAESIVPTLRETAAESESNNTLCDVAVQALHNTGLFGLWSPDEVGGTDSDFATQVDVLIKLAEADMSACWALMIGASSTALMAGGLPEEGLAEVFAGKDLPTGAVSLRPSGLATEVEVHQQHSEM